MSRRLNFFLSFFTEFFFVVFLLWKFNVHHFHFRSKWNVLLKRKQWQFKTPCCTYLFKFFWNFDAAENSCFIVVFFFGFLRCKAGVSNCISDASSGRAIRTAVNKSSKIRCRLPVNLDSLCSISRQPTISITNHISYLLERMKKEENCILDGITLFGIDWRYCPQPLTLPQQARKKYRRPWVKSLIRHVEPIIPWKLFHSFTSRSPTILLKSQRVDHWTIIKRKQRRKKLLYTMLYQWPTLLRNDGSKITIVNPSVNPILLAKKLYSNETY